MQWICFSWKNPFFLLSYIFFPVFFPSLFETVIIFQTSPSSLPIGVSLRQRSPITARPFTPSLCGQPVKDFLCSALFFFTFYFFSTTLHGATWAWSRWNDCSRGKVSKQHREGESEETMQRVRQPSHRTWWTEPLTSRKTFFHFDWDPEEAKQSDRTAPRGNIYLLL